jgi:bifunctional DNase/RNase
MIEMKVMGIALDTRTGSPIVVLHDKENRRALPIWIGSAEASSIIRKIENLSVSRPMTHDLIISMVEKTGYEISKVEINDVEKETYFATIFLKNDKDEVLEIDSRPSDAIAIAIRVDAPIFVNAKVLSTGSVSTDSAKDAQEAEEFKNFVQSIKPSDFARLMKDNDHHESDQ